MPLKPKHPYIKKQPPPPGGCFLRFRLCLRSKLSRRNSKLAKRNFSGPVFEAGEPGSGPGAPAPGRDIPAGPGCPDRVRQFPTSVYYIVADKPLRHLSECHVNDLCRDSAIYRVSLLCVRSKPSRPNPQQLACNERASTCDGDARFAPRRRDQ